MGRRIGSFGHLVCVDPYSADVALRREVAGRLIVDPEMLWRRVHRGQPLARRSGCDGLPCAFG